MEAGVVRGLCGGLTAAAGLQAGGRMGAEKPAIAKVPDGADGAYSLSVDGRHRGDAGRRTMVHVYGQDVKVLQSSGTPVVSTVVQSF